MKVIDAVMRRAMAMASPHMRQLGLEFLSMADGRAVARIPYAPQLVGDPATGVLHGGVVTSLLDSCGGAAVISKLGVPQPIATLDLRIDYLRPSTPRQPLFGEVECYKLTRQVAFARGTAHNGDAADPVASMAATFMLRTQAVRTPRGSGDRA